MMSESCFERKKSKMLVYLSASYRLGGIQLHGALLGEKGLFLSLLHTEALWQRTFLLSGPALCLRGLANSSFTWEYSVILAGSLEGIWVRKGKKRLFLIL